jgi:hypothetical protein
MLESPLFAGLVPTPSRHLNGSQRTKKPAKRFHLIRCRLRGFVATNFCVCCPASLYFRGCCLPAPARLKLSSGGELETGWRPFSRRNASCFSPEPFRRRVFARYSIVCVLRPSGLAVPLARLFILVEHEMAPQSPLGWT